jgi:hypothetical protein
MLWGGLTDQYTIRARIVPSLLIALPVGLVALACFPNGLSSWNAAWGLGVWGVASVLLGQLGRHAGRRKEPRLFERWGGAPTTRCLRHNGAKNHTILERTHKKLKALMRTKIPTRAEETADPATADEVYDACIRFLRDKTRDRKKFNLVFEENCNYGFCRNLWGLKPLGLTITILALVAIGTLALVDREASTMASMVRFLIPGVLTLLILLGWLFVVTPRWVQVPAETYADRLLEALERL